MIIGTNTKITVFGDSIGKGINTDSGKIEVMADNAVGLFEKEFNINVDNRSVYGQSLKRIVERGLVDRYIENIDRSQKNVVVIELGGNDADFNWRQVAENPDVYHGPQTDVKQFSKFYGETIKKLNGAGVKVVVCTIVPIDSERFFNRVIGGLTDKNRVLEFFKGDFNTIHRHQEMFNNEILKNAYSTGSLVIDLRKEFLDTNDFENLMCYDGIHPNAQGHQKIYGAVNEFLLTA